MPPQSRGSAQPNLLQSIPTKSVSSLPPLSLSEASSYEDDDGEFELEEEEEDAGTGQDAVASSRPQRPMYQYRSSSYTHLSSSAFAPPFYGRPPVQLPPSPSLTSLLRPNFSSRPTTPDPSSDEGTSNTKGDTTGAQTPISAATSTLTNSFRNAKPIPRASPRVPTYEYYGFTLYLTSSLAFIGYLLWSFLPSPFLHQLGIHYYPDRWWALAIPAWTVMFILYIYVALAAYNTGYLTLSMNSIECLVDDAANVAVIDSRGKLIHEEPHSWVGNNPGQDHASHSKRSNKSKPGRRSRQSRESGSQPGPELEWSGLWNEGTDAVLDIPLGGVCEILYGQTDDADVRGNAHDR